MVKLSICNSCFVPKNYNCLKKIVFLFSSRLKRLNLPGGSFNDFNALYAQVRALLAVIRPEYFTYWYIVTDNMCVYQ